MVYNFIFYINDTQRKNKTYILIKGMISII